MEAVIRQAGLERTAVPVKKKRIGSVDICKGIAMIYVIIVHFFPGAMGLSTAIGFMLYFYYAISTYFYKPQRTAWENIKRRVKQLLVPMAEYIIGLNIISYLYMWARGIGHPTVRGCIHSMWLIFKGTRTLQNVNHMQMTADPALSVFTPYYFLELLFVSSVVFYLVAEFALKKFSRMCWVSLSLIALSCIIVQVRSITWIWMAEVSFGIAGMMLWGAWAGKKKLVTRIQENLKSWKVWVPAVLCAASYYLLNTTAGQGRYTLGYGPGYTVLTCALLTALGGYLFLLTGILLEKVPGIRWILEFIGRNSLYFLLMHMFLGCILNDLTGWNLSMANFDMTKTMNAFSGSWGWEQVVGMVLVMILCGLYAALVRKLKSVRLQRKEAV